MIGRVAQSWWLMDCSLPDLNWARLRINANGSAEVLDCDGTVHRFASEDEATSFLSEDEFVPFDDLDEGTLPDGVRPPEGGSDTEIIPQLLVRRS